MRYILTFEEDFPEAQVVRLEQNYRSTKTILRRRAVEKGHRLRREKHLWTENDQGVPITICHAMDEHEEALFVAREAERLVSQDGYGYRDVAVMYRTNAQSRALEERSCAAGCRTSWSGARASTSAARSRTSWPTCA